MQTLSCKDILNATGGSLISGSEDTQFTSISTDSRKITNGDLFIPLVGERFDGHEFINSSFELGACGTLTQKQTYPVEGKVIIRVENTLKALGDIATVYRQRFSIPFIGITGSVGKTSTKDMVASVLNQEFNILKTEGNFNNEIGLPLTIFKLDSTHKGAVIEMGMRGLGEISYLTAIAKPDIAIITNIGMSHIEKLGSKQNILKAKLEILEGLSKDGLVILNGDDSLLYGTKGLLKFRTVFYGMEEGLDYQAYNIRTVGEHGIHFEITIKDKDYTVHVPVPGIHNVHNALAAIAVGVELNIPIEKIIEGIRQFAPSKMRLNIVSNNNIKIVNDTYNASPQSMEGAINVLKDISKTGRTIAVLGDMLELGDYSYKAHIDVGKYAVISGVDYIITVGENGKNIAQGAIGAGAAEESVLSFNNTDEASRFLQDFVKQGDFVLVKGSRGMRMEKIVEHLMEV